MSETAVVEYAPHGAAREIFARRDPEVLLDGPAGTGKSRACLEKLHLAALKYPKMRGIIVRKVRDDLREAALQTFDIHVLSPFDNVRKVGGENVQHYAYPNGSRIVVAGLDRDTKVMSAEYDMAYAQEATELDEEEWEKLTTRLRNGKMPYQQLIADCNPGAQSHWLNQRCERGVTTRLTSRHEDNPVLWDGEGWTAGGQSYIARLDNLTGARKERLRYGKWVSSEGAAFAEFYRPQHVIEPFAIPGTWTRWTATDYGYNDPWATVWLARSPDRQRVVCYREAYQTGLTAKEQAQRFKFLTGMESIRLSVADPSMWGQREKLSTSSVADEYAMEGVHLQAANNDRLGGWAKLHEALAWQQLAQRANPPRLQIFDHCENLIREIENIEVSKTRPEDVDTHASDHALDALRYGLMVEGQRSKPDSEAESGYRTVEIR